MPDAADGRKLSVNRVCHAPGQRLEQLVRLAHADSDDHLGDAAVVDGVRQPIRAGQAVLWSPGEAHESGSDEGMSVVITQSSARLPRGGDAQA